MTWLEAEEAAPGCSVAFDLWCVRRAETIVVLVAPYVSARGFWTVMARVGGHVAAIAWHDERWNLVG